MLSAYDYLPNQSATTIAHLLWAPFFLFAVCCLLSIPKRQFCVGPRVMTRGPSTPKPLESIFGPSSQPLCKLGASRGKYCLFIFLITMTTGLTFASDHTREQVQTRPTQWLPFECRQEYYRRPSVDTTKEMMTSTNDDTQENIDSIFGTSGCS